MHEETAVDVVVVGAGVVGLAVAAELSAIHRVAVVERHGTVGMETSSHNSGVIHAGIYYPTGSLKHVLCIEGNALLYEWCTANAVRAERIGKLIVAVDADDLDALDAVAQRASENGVPDIRKIRDEAERRRLEPAVRCTAALWSGSTGIVDQMGLMRSLARALEARGGSLALKHEVVAIERGTTAFTLQLRAPDGVDTVVTCDVLVNAAGLGAPALASMLGYQLDGSDASPRLRQAVNKGRYYDIITSAKARALHHLIYPVPEHARGGLGVHVTLDGDGGARLGPDTEWLDDDAQLDYRADDLRRDEFLASGRRYLPFLEPEDVAPGMVGYRPKLQFPGGPQHDFLIWRDGGYVHLGGIESPGLTSCLAIARRVAAML